MMRDTGPDKSDREAVRYETRVAMTYSLSSILVPKSAPKEALAINMSSSGIRFIGREKLFPGAKLQVKILLGRKPIDAVGKVIRCTQDEKGEYYETAFAFTEIDQAGKERINAWYYSKRFGKASVITHFQTTQKKMKPEHAEKRPSVQYRKSGEGADELWKGAEIKELSSERITISSFSAPGEGEMLELSINVADDAMPVRAKAKVLTVRREDLRYEIGMEFSEMSESDRVRLTESSVQLKFFVFFPFFFLTFLRGIGYNLCLVLEQYI